AVHTFAHGRITMAVIRRYIDQIRVLGIDGYWGAFCEPAFYEGAGYLTQITAKIGGRASKHPSKGCTGVHHTCFRIASDRCHDEARDGIERDRTVWADEGDRGGAANKHGCWPPEATFRRGQEATKERVIPDG